MGKQKESLIRNAATQQKPDIDLAADEVVESAFYGIERKFRRAVMFDLSLRGGVFASFPYSYVTKILYDPSIGIEIYVVDSVISIKGRHLTNIYSYLKQHRAAYIKESIVDFDDTPESQTFVSNISIKKLG